MSCSPWLIKDSSHVKIICYIREPCYIKLWLELWLRYHKIPLGSSHFFLLATHLQSPAKHNNIELLGPILKSHFLSIKAFWMTVNLLERVRTKPIPNWPKDGSRYPGLSCYTPCFTVTGPLCQKYFKIDHTLELKWKCKRQALFSPKMGSKLWHTKHKNIQEVLFYYFSSYLWEVRLCSAWFAPGQSPWLVSVMEALSYSLVGRALSPTKLGKGNPPRFRESSLRP